MKNSTYLLASEKQRIADTFEKFIRTGFDKRYFTKALYRHLSVNFGFIAHFDISGFYHARFENPQGRRQTFDSIINASRWSFNDDNTSGTADLNTAIRDLCVKYSNEVNTDAKKLEAERLQSLIKDAQARIAELSK